MDSVGGSTTSISFSTAVVEVFVLEKKDIIVLSAQLNSAGQSKDDCTYF